MPLFELFKLAYQSLTKNRWQAFLTMLGIIIGVAGVVMILSVGAGAQSLIFNQVESMGSNLIGIMPGASDDNGPPASVMGITVTTLINEDLEAIVDAVPEVVAATGYVQGLATLRWENQQSEVTYVGTASSYPNVEDVTLVSGRYFSEIEDNGMNNVAVLGSQIATDIFGSQNPIGQKIKLKREAFKVIGVFAERGGSFFSSQDEQIFIPLQTAQKKLLGIGHLSMARLKVGDNADLDSIINQTEDVLRYRHDINTAGEDDFTVRSQTQALDVLGTLTGALNFFLAAIAAIALLVGGVGIMNIMLVAVTERTAEIGLRKAVGAKSSIIIWQFLLEAILLTLFGGILGIILGALLAGFIALIANYMGYHWDFIVSLVSILISSGVAIAVGLFFGLYPAFKAAQLDPVEALRYE
ncbi:MAG: ABC transporter permease [Candidatus Komeilibacteria bacterium]